MNKQFILIGIFLSCLVIESFAPLRAVDQPRLRRIGINIALSVVSMLIMRYIFFPVVWAVSVFAETKHWGIIPYLGLSGIAASIIGFLLLDYTLYFWHFLNHKVRFFWRFHSVHHADLNMDVSTASRFHFGELALSSVYRSLQVVLFGIPPELLLLFETVVTISAQFHHSNIRLPLKIERQLVNWIVTPRMHGVHHSIVQNETDSNYCATLNIWDRLHQTLRLNVPQREITIGIPQYRNMNDVSLLGSLILAFRKPRSWKLPGGQVPKRALPQHSPQHLLA
jgi:sterol desaturase/sphingolipid hydroxylase (fatty acid hydroxylase superfamily)